MKPIFYETHQRFSPSKFSSSTNFFKSPTKPTNTKTKRIPTNLPTKSAKQYYSITHLTVNTYGIIHPTKIAYTASSTNGLRNNLRYNPSVIKFYNIQQTPS
jgi:hypothetical protein